MKNKKEDFGKINNNEQNYGYVGLIFAKQIESHLEDREI